MILSTNNLNFILGLLEASSIDKNVKNSFIELKKFFLDKFEAKHEYKKIFKYLEKNKFNVEDAKNNFDFEKKDLFFNLVILVCYLDNFSDKEIFWIKNIAEKMDFPISNVEKYISEMKFLHENTIHKDPLYWFEKMMKGYINYLVSNDNNYEGYFSFRHLYFVTNGRINKFLLFLKQILYSENLFEDEFNILGDKSELILDNLKNNGVHVFSELLPERLINNLYNFAINNQCYEITSEKVYMDCFNDDPLFFKDLEIKASRYDYKHQDLNNNLDILEIGLKYKFAQLSQLFTKTNVVYNLPFMWWTTTTDDYKHSYTGQVFHIDIDRIESLLFIIFLVDIDSNNGPHTYVKGSHKNKPLHLLEDRRMNKDELIDFYGQEKFVSIKGKKGSVIVIDPLGYHKSESIISGDRLVLKLNFSSDWFGEDIKSIKVDNIETINYLKEQSINYPNLFSKIDF